MGLQTMKENSFLCPDGQTILVKDCMSQCRMGQRCLAKPLLVNASRVRDLNRTNFSVTEVLSPTLYMYLKATHNETINPFSSIAATVGTSVHGILENCLPHNYAGEFRLNYQGLTGQMDCIDLEHHTLYDYKVVGAYKCATMMGGRPLWKPYIITRGKRKGETEMRQQWFYDGLHHYGDYCKQQNLYRILLGKHGIPIEDMFLQVIIKEPINTIKTFNLDKQCYLLKLPKMNDQRLLDYALYKKDALVNAIATNTMPRQCSAKDRWVSKTYPMGRRCKDYCSVSYCCPYYNKGS